MVSESCLRRTGGVTHSHNRRPRSIHQDFATMFNLPPVTLEIHLSLQGGSARIGGRGPVSMDALTFQGTPTYSSFKSHMDIILLFFDHPPTCVDIFYVLNVDKNSKF